MVVGRHIIAEFYGVDKELIAYEDKVKSILEPLCDKVDFEKVGSIYKQFNPWGVTGVILIEESHLSIHTWPEYGLVNLDIFTCGDLNEAHKAFELLVKAFEPEYYKQHVLDRG